MTGHGIRARIGGDAVLVGKPALFTLDGGSPAPDELLQTDARLKADGRSTMLVSQAGRFLGVVGLMDTPRENVAAVLERLRALGIEQTIMISGDAQAVADAVAREVGIDQARGDLLPEDKVEAIRVLRQSGEVAMVGDGVNDAPAMARATVGIAMGAAGSDVALETADVALMADDLSRLPFAVGLSRKARGIIRQNLWMSLGMVAFLVPATVLGLGIGPAVALHEGSTLIVVSAKAQKKAKTIPPFWDLFHLVRVIVPKGTIAMQPIEPLASAFPELGNSVESVIASLRDGLPVGRIEALSSTLGLSVTRVGSVLSIAPSTLSRRRKDGGKLDRDESERAYRLARLVQKSAVMIGSLEGGVRWLKMSQYALGEQTPLDYADTEVGARVVENLIGRIEHGIPA